MSTMTDIILELVESCDYLKATDTPDAVCANIIAGIAAKIRQLAQMSTGDAVKIRDAVATSGLDGPMTSVLKTAVDETLAEALTGKRDKKAALTQQQLLNPPSYLSGNDWVRIGEKPMNSDRIISVMAARAARVGIRSLHEQTVRAFVSIALSAYLQDNTAWPMYHEVFRWVNTFKTEVARFQKVWGFTHIVKYPSSPHDLPPDIFSAAYDPDDGPVKKDVSMFDQIGSRVPLRKNSQLLVNERQSMMGRSFSQQGMFPMQMHAREGPIPGLRFFGQPQPHMQASPSAPLALCDAQQVAQLRAQQSFHQLGQHPPLQPSGLEMQPQEAQSQLQGADGVQGQSCGASDNSDQVPAQPHAGFSDRFKLGGALGATLCTKPPLNTANVKAEHCDAADMEDVVFSALKSRNAERVALTKKPAMCEGAKVQAKPEPESCANDGHADDDTDDGVDDAEAAIGPVMKAMKAASEPVMKAIKVVGHATAMKASKMTPEKAMKAVGHAPAMKASKKNAKATTTMKTASAASVLATCMRNTRVDPTVLRSSNRRTGCSKAYHSAVVVANNAGCNSEDAKSIGRACYRKFCEAFDKFVKSAKKPTKTPMKIVAKKPAMMTKH